MTRTRIALAALAAVLPVLTACGDDKPNDGTGAAAADTSVSVSTEPTDSDSTQPAETTPPKLGDKGDGDPAAVLKDLLTAYYENDADTACGLQTERYTQSVIADSIKQGYVKNGATCADVVASSSALFKAFGVEPSKSTYEELSNDGKAAKVQVTQAGGDSPEKYLLVNTDGNWLLDQELG